MPILNNVFIITSTINTPWGLIPVNDRYLQTLDTIESVKNKDSKAAIILIDNSSIPLDYQQYNTLLNTGVTFLDTGDRKPCKELNSSGVKGAGEAYMLLVAIDYIKQNNLLPKRVFKLSGRYKLTDLFDINLYDNLCDRFVFKTRNINEYGATSLHTRLWSACGSLIDEMEELISISFYQHIMQNITIEEAMFKYICKDKLIELDNIHCEGIIAPWNKLIND